MFWKKKTTSSRQNTGQWGETQALQYLRKKGYAIVATNYRKRFGEIDIIATKDDVMVFIEVKCRRGQSFGSPLEAVDFRKQQRISRVAMEYIQAQQAGECNARFDVIAVELLPGKEHARIEHIENAFDCIL